MQSEILLIIPTHNHPTTLPWTLRSAQAQTIENISIVVLGDGVNDDTRDAISPFLVEDRRISFVDKPKGERHGEAYRHELILECSERFIAYLGDDDLLFKNHLETLVGVIGDRDFANTLPAGIDGHGNIFIAPADLADPRCLNWHLVENKIQNTVSLTGVLHTRDSYLRLEQGWHPAPQGVYTDLHMWRHYFKLPGFKAKTSTYSTVAKFPADHRTEMSPAQREFEIRTFWEEMQHDDFQKTWNERIHNHLFAVASNHFMDSSDRLNLIEVLNQNLSEMQSSYQVLENRFSEELQSLQVELDSNKKALVTLKNSTSWKVTRPFRWLSKKLRLIFM